MSNVNAPQQTSNGDSGSIWRTRRIQHRVFCRYSTCRGRNTYKNRGHVHALCVLDQLGFFCSFRDDVLPADAAATAPEVSVKKLLVLPWVRSALRQDTCVPQERTEPRFPTGPVSIYPFQVQRQLVNCNTSRNPRPGRGRTHHWTDRAKSQQGGSSNPHGITGTLGDDSSEPVELIASVGPDFPPAS